MLATSRLSGMAPRMHHIHATILKIRRAAAREFRSVDVGNGGWPTFAGQRWEARVQTPPYSLSYAVRLRACIGTFFPKRKGSPASATDMSKLPARPTGFIVLAGDGYNQQT
jgi:hypothetical protein